MCTNPHTTKRQRPISNSVFSHFKTHAVSFHFELFFFIVVQWHLSPFPPITLPCSTHHPHLPHSVLPLPHCLCPWILYRCSLTWPLPFFPVIPLPSGYCQFVLYFHVSVYILRACLFCCLGSTYRWDHMVFVFHHMVYFTYHNALQFHPCCHEG